MFSFSPTSNYLELFLSESHIHTRSVLRLAFLMKIICIENLVDNCLSSFPFWLELLMSQIKRSACMSEEKLFVLKLNCQFWAILALNSYINVTAVVISSVRYKTKLLVIGLFNLDARLSVVFKHLFFLSLLTKKNDRETSLLEENIPSVRSRRIDDDLVSSNGNNPVNEYIDQVDRVSIVLRCFYV